jgi:hypothetical protein
MLRRPLAISVWRSAGSFRSSATPPWRPRATCAGRGSGRLRRASSTTPITGSMASASIAPAWPNASMA